ncbi:unnamed protein product [Effrenium voratum]|nr:unnamed protein product [Effrenium voratum]
MQGADVALKRYQPEGQPSRLETWYQPDDQTSRLRQWPSHQHCGLQAFAGDSGPAARIGLARLAIGCRARRVLNRHQPEDQPSPLETLLHCLRHRHQHYGLQAFAPLLEVAQPPLANTRAVAAGSGPATNFEACNCHARRLRCSQPTPTSYCYTSKRRPESAYSVIVAPSHCPNLK